MHDLKSMCVGFPNQFISTITESDSFKGNITDTDKIHVTSNNH
jgi:hypothetical protein